jgi:hypothetical protein
LPIKCRVCKWRNIAGPEPALAIGGYGIEKPPPPTAVGAETGLNAATGTGNAFASFLLGAADQEIVGSPVEFSSVLPYCAGYVQDDIKATSRLTLLMANYKTGLNSGGFLRF